MKHIANFLDFKIFEGTAGVDDFPFYAESPDGVLEPFSSWDYMMDAILRVEEQFTIELDLEDDDE